MDSIEYVQYRYIAYDFARTEIRKHSFSVRVVNRWNGLPNSVRAAENQEAFKGGLKGTVA